MLGNVTFALNTDIKFPGTLCVITLTVSLSQGLDPNPSYTDIVVVFLHVLPVDVIEYNISSMVYGVFPGSSYYLWGRYRRSEIDMKLNLYYDMLAWIRSLQLSCQLEHWGSTRDQWKAAGCRRRLTLQYSLYVLGICSLT